MFPAALIRALGGYSLYGYGYSVFQTRKSPNGGEPMNADRLIVNRDGTVTDSETLLMWTVSEFGQSSDGKICEGEGSGFYWKEACKLFGRGQEIPPYFPPAPDGGRNFEKELTEQTYKKYKFSKRCPVYIMIGGCQPLKRFGH
jgi:hypothetical protein